MMLLAAVVLMASVTAAWAQRGTDGELRMLYWQAPSVLNPFLSGGTKDIHAAAFVIEPLARYDDNANMVPALAAEIPTVENGGVAADLKSVTWKLRKGVTWSD
ncbi:MAG: peptide ABC transporter substrate-binding protein, partial [Deltaproteobacteria bacterium]|nr:peptide ABC transporter substrate-binding protein [Deltaproteobacteria bacterium]